MDTMLTPFAISIAANIVTSLFARNDTEKEIRKAFQEAIEMWSPNEDIRRYKEKEIQELLNIYIDDPAFEYKDLSDEQRSFLDCFEKCVVKHDSAALYLSAIKERDFYDMVMSSINIVHTKLDDISKKLDDANLKHEDLYFEAVVEINGVLNEVVEEPLNALLYGIVSAFDDDIYAYTDLKEDGTIEVIIDEESKLKEEGGEEYRPKCQNVEYDWEQENRIDWTQINPNIDFWDMFSESYIAAFQLMRIDFYKSIEQLQKCIDRKTINDQLSTEEKRQLAEIIADMRAVEAVVEDHRDIFSSDKAYHFQNLEVDLQNSFDDHGLKVGHFAIIYNDGKYKEVVTETLAPVEAKDMLLGVYMINPDYYYKLTGYLGDLFDNVVEWWKMTNGN